MAIAEDIHARCRLCTEKATSILTGMIDGDRIEPITVQARRTAADIAGDTVYALLGRAFITPIDREDLWLLHESAECVWCEAEDTALLLYHCGRPLPSACQTAIRAAASCCAAAGQVAESYRDVDAVAQRMRVLREAQHTCHTTMRGGFADASVRRICEGAYRVIRSCEQLIGILRYTAMKNG